MSRLSIYPSILLLLLALSFAEAQQTNRWSFGGALGSSTQLSFAYNVNTQWQFSFVFGPFGNIASSGTDRIGLSAIYFFDTSDNPMFIGFAPGITTRVPHSYISVIPIGITHKVSDDFRICLAAEFIRMKNEFKRTMGGIGISLGGFIYL